MDAMTAACERVGVKLAGSFQRRLSPDNVLMKKLLSEQALGRVFAADMRVKFYRDMNYYDSGNYRDGYAVDGGGPFMQQAAHNVDLFVWFFGMPERVVSMLGTFAHDIEVEDRGVALMRHAGGMIGTLTAASAARPGSHSSCALLLDAIVGDYEFGPKAGIPLFTGMKLAIWRNGD